MRFAVKFPSRKITIPSYYSADLIVTGAATLVPHVIERLLKHAARQIMLVSSRNAIFTEEAHSSHVNIPLHNTRMLYGCTYRLGSIPPDVCESNILLFHLTLRGYAYSVSDDNKEDKGVR